MRPSAILPLEGTVDGPTKKSHTVKYLQIMTASYQITCAIPWLPCEQLPYPRISLIRRRDKSNLPLPILSYKYFLLGYSFSIASFYSPNSTFLAAVLFENFKNPNRNFLQQPPSFWSSSSRENGHSPCLRSVHYPSFSHLYCISIHLQSVLSNLFLLVLLFIPKNF